MADIKVTWLAPSASELTNVDKLLIYRSSVSADDAGTTCTNLQALADSDSEGATTKIKVQTITNAGSNLSDQSAATWTDTGVTTGTYRYAVFSKNNAGANACQTSDGSVSTAVTV